MKGIIALVIGAVLWLTAAIINQKVDNAIPQIDRGYNACNSTLGQLGSLISGNIAQKCQGVNQAVSLVQNLQTLDTILSIAGIGLIIFGIFEIIRVRRRRHLVAK